MDEKKDGKSDYEERRKHESPWRRSMPNLPENSLAQDHILSVDLVRTLSEPELPDHSTFVPSRRSRCAKIDWITYDTLNVSYVIQSIYFSLPSFVFRDERCKNQSTAWTLFWLQATKTLRPCRNMVWDLHRRHPNTFQTILNSAHDSGKSRRTRWSASTGSKRIDNSQESQRSTFGRITD